MALDMEKLASFCRDTGFIYPSSSIYGGINGFWDYGPLGVELKKNIKDAWWFDMVRNPPRGPDGKEIAMVGVDCSLIMNPKVWEASGHVAGFADPMVDCKETRKRFRADQLIVVKEKTDTGTNPMFAFQIGDQEGQTTAHKKLAKYLKLSLPLPGEQVHLKPLTDIPVSEYHRIYAPEAKETGTLTAPRSFNLMFKTYVGALEDASAVAYLRPETAQGIFVNFKNVLNSTRLKLPFGIAQIGKAFRNEINPRNFTFRSREFEQMEIEFFCRPEESMKWYEYWRDVRKGWYTKLGIQSDRLRPREQGKEELAHYSIGTTDIEYLFPFSEEPQELEGVAHRGEYDLTQHMKHSGKDLSYFDEELWQKADKSAYGNDKKKLDEAKQNPPYRFMPHVIEPSAGADRFTLAVICEAYTEDELPGEKGQMEKRIFLRFHPRLAPIKAAVFPLVKKDGMPEIAEKLYRELKADFNVVYDEGGSIGRRYRRQDEVGTPFCVTIDTDTLNDQTVTIRDRDTAQQRRVAITSVADEIRRAMRTG